MRLCLCEHLQDLDELVSAARQRPGPLEQRQSFVELAHENLELRRLNQALEAQGVLGEGRDISFVCLFEQRLGFG